MPLGAHAAGRGGSSQPPPGSPTVAYRGSNRVPQPGEAEGAADAGERAGGRQQTERGLGQALCEAVTCRRVTQETVSSHSQRKREERRRRKQAACTVRRSTDGAGVHMGRGLALPL